MHSTCATAVCAGSPTNWGDLLPRRCAGVSAGTGSSTATIPECAGSCCALLTDLRHASRGPWPLSHRRAQRRWAFVLLLPRIDERDGARAGRAERVRRTGRGRTITGAADPGRLRRNATGLRDRRPADLSRPNGLADKVFSLLHEGSAEPVRLLRLPRDDEEHTTRERLLARQTVTPRRDRAADWI